MSDYLDSYWPPPFSLLSTRGRQYALAAAIATPIVVVGILSDVRPGGPPDRAVAACASVSGLNQAGAPDFRRLRADGTAYTDLATKLRTARETDGNMAAWSYQRLAATCAKHVGN